MIKCKVNTEVLKALKPCEDRLNNWLECYNNFDGDIVEFLDLPNITHRDKIWVATKLLPTTLAVIFAIDCVASSQKYAAASYYAAYYAAAAYAAYAASYAAADAATYAAYYAADAAYTAYAADAAAYAADAAYTAYAAYASYDASYAAAADAARQREEQSQIEALIWLIQNHKKGD